MSQWPPVVIAAPGEFGASGFYRMMWPLTTTDARGMIQLRLPTNGMLFPIDVLPIIKPDSILFHRSHQPHQIKYIEFCRDKLDTVTVYTLDDWVDKIPKYSLWSKQKESPKEWGRDVHKAIRLCDRLIVTNQLLANVYGSHANTYIIPNYLPELLWKPIESIVRKPRTSSKPRIGWSGAAGHEGDLELLNEIAKILGDTVQWVFLCENVPKGFVEFNAEHHPACQINDYPKHLYELDLDIALAPLVPNDFNRAKSNLRVLEYGAAGYPVIASDLNCYYDSKEYVTLLPFRAEVWAETIKNKLKDLDLLKEEGQKLRTWVWENYKLEDHIDEYAAVLAPDGIPFIPKYSQETETVDLLITTHNNLEVIKPCIESVIKSLPTNKTKVIIKVYDDSVGEEIPTYLKSIEGIEVHTEGGNDGYITKINTAIQSSENDVITLNSDTIVPTEDWIDRLRNNAYCNERVSSVTPLSNQATILSYPNPQGSELKPRLVNFYDSIAKELNPAPFFIPTSVGFCTYYKRSALTDVGLFDKHGFGDGYGEENDWSMRSSRRSWINLVALNTYVGHVGNASFGMRKKQLEQTGNQLLSVRWPTYFKIIEQYTSQNPLGNAKAALDIASIRKSTTHPRTLYFAHSLGGGMETFLQKCLKEDEGALIIRVDHEKSNFIKLEVAGEDYYNLVPLDMRLVPPPVLINQFRDFQVNKIYVQTTFGFDYNVPVLIRNLAKALDIPYEIMLHDYFTVCPRLRMIDATMSYCGRPEESVCETCIASIGSPIGQVNVGAWRKMYGDFLWNAEKVYAPSQYTSEMIKSFYPEVFIESKYHESPDELTPIYPPLKYVENEGLRVAILGVLTTEKGSVLIQKCAEYIAAKKLPITFVVIGALVNNQGQQVQQGPALEVLGLYKEEDANKAIQNAKCHMSFFASLWPETYSYTLSHAFRHNLYPVAIAMGAIQERMQQRDFGVTIPLNKKDDIPYIVDTLWENRNWNK